MGKRKEERKERKKEREDDAMFKIYEFRFISIPHVLCMIPR